MTSNFSGFFEVRDALKPEINLLNVKYLLEFLVKETKEHYLFCLKLKIPTKIEKALKKQVQDEHKEEESLFLSSISMNSSQHLHRNTEAQNLRNMLRDAPFSYTGL